MRPEQERAFLRLQKATNDVRAARLAMGADPPITGVSAFHSQQAAEKALKAFLVYHVVPFEFVHDLLYLLHLCVGVDPSLNGLAEAAAVLTPYAIKFRYPTSGEPAPAEAEVAAKLADEVVESVRARLEK